MSAFVTSLQTEMTGWADTISPALTAVVLAFVVFAGIFLAVRWLLRATRAVR